MHPDTVHKSKQRVVDEVTTDDGSDMEEDDEMSEEVDHYPSLAKLGTCMNVIGYDSDDSSQEVLCAADCGSSQVCKNCAMGQRRDLFGSCFN